MPFVMPDMLPAMPARECDRCPDYVVRCAHLDGDPPGAVWLVDGERWYRDDGEHEGHHALFAYRVARVTPGAPDPHRCSCYIADAIGEIADARTREDADRAFERFEAILLGRGEDD